MGQINCWPALLVQSVNAVRQTHATLATSVKISVFTPWRRMRECRYIFTQGFTNCGRMNLVRRCLEIWGGIKSVLPWLRPFLTSELQPDERLRHAPVTLPTGCRICCQANVSFLCNKQLQACQLYEMRGGPVSDDRSVEVRHSVGYETWNYLLICMSQCCSLLYGLKHLKKCTQVQFLSRASSQEIVWGKFDRDVFWRTFQLVLTIYEANFQLWRIQFWS
jgi:hypothetical protein